MIFINGPYHQMRRICLLLILTTTSLCLNLVQGQYNPLTKITDDNDAQYNPAIYGDYIVYEEWLPGEGIDIILHNITSGEKIKINSGLDGMASNPDIFGDRIVWQDNRSGEYKIYTYLISRPDLGDFLLMDLEGEQTTPAIYGNTLVWVDHRGDEYSANIFMYDINTAVTTQITDDDDLQQYSPDIDGPNIVYVDGRNGNPDIYLYNINTQEETRLTEDHAAQTNPSIHKGRVVWEDERNGNTDLYMHHIYFWPGSVYENYDWEIYTGEGFREMSLFSDKNPAVYDDYIVFQSYRNGKWDLYLYSFVNDIFGRTTPLITEEKDQINPAIYDNQIVWQDERDWDGASAYEADIWLWTRPPGADLGVSIIEYGDTVVTGTVMTYTILVKNFGDQEATNVLFTQTLAEEVEYIHATSRLGNSFELTGNILSCDIGILDVGETDSINVFVKALWDGTITSTCELTADEDDPIEENNSETVTSIIKWVIPKVIGTGGSPQVLADNQGNAHTLYLEYSGVSQGYMLYASNNTGHWEKDYELTESGDIKYKSMAVDSDGYIHIVYATGTFRDKSIMYINNVGGDWSVPSLIKEHTKDCASLTLQLDSEDKMHIAYMKSSSVWDSLFYMYKSSDTWETKLITEQSFSMSSFVLDSNDHAHLVYISGNENLDPYSYKPTYVTNSPDGTWSVPEYVEENYYGGFSESFTFDLAVDKAGDPHVIYIGTTEQAEDPIEILKYAVKSEGQWQTEVIDEREITGDVSIVTDLNNKPHLLYPYYQTWQNTELIYLRGSDDGWEKHFLEPGNYEILQLDMCSDAMGDIHAVCRENIGEQFFINYYFINGENPEPDLFVLPDRITFDPQAIDTSSAYQRIIIQNSGNKLLSIYDVYISESDAEHFSILNNTCQTLNFLGTCIVDVAFNPQSTGYKYAKLRIISNDPDTPDTRIPLEGIGVDYLISDYGLLAFGEVEVGDSASNIYTIKNEGNTEQIIQSISIEEDVNEDFHLIGLQSSPINIAAQDSIQFAICFKPETSGEKTAKLKIIIAENEVDRQISGTAVDPTHLLAGTIMIDELTPANSGRIYVYQPAEDNSYTDLWHKPLSGNEYFEFIAIPEGNITLRFAPDTVAYPEYLNTYLGNTPVYSEADFFYLDKDTSGLIITLVQAPTPPSGNNEIEGVFVEEDAKKSGGILKKGSYHSNGTALSEVAVYLFDQSANVFDYDNTNSSGEFKFQSIPSGQYKFAADYPGFSMDPENPNLDISGENQKFNITAIAQNKLIKITVEKITGIDLFSASEKIHLYPNPANEYIFLEFDDSLVENEYELKINSMTGTVVKEKSIQMSGHSQQHFIQIYELPCGTYIVTLSGKGILLHYRFIKI